MAKHPFLVGFLVAELLRMEIDMSGSEGHDLIRRQCPEEAYALPLLSDKNSSLEIESFDNKRMRIYKLTSEQRSNAINKCQSLAMAYVIDQSRTINMALCSKLGMLVKQSGQVPMASMLNSARYMLAKLFVRGISYTIDDHSLKEAFSSFGGVVDAKVISDRDTGRIRGFGFVNFSSEDFA
ncbi:hypothetical protein LWI29_003308 [Acer saccharum]|uniref:RRM domain-containing protein n=1 Tax=Acer saccharum TaxID=4024 RepID=A0AA39T441_ACESA|nr:hypothetical protein LWI29_003308 [Acer saccharum]